MQASTSTPAMSWSSASSRWCGARSAARCWPASAASARWWSCRPATGGRCWCPAPTASAPSCAWRSTPAGTTPSASTWSPCAPTTSSCRAPNRCFSSTTTRPASCRSRSPKRSCAVSSRAACRPARRWWAARPRRCPACTRATTTISPASASAWWRRTPSSMARAVGRRRCGHRLAFLRPAFQRLLAHPQAGGARGADAGHRARGGPPLFDRLLTPTRIYVKPLLALMRALPVHALAHITGGGLTDNIPRVLPAGLEAVLERAQLAARSGVRLAAAAPAASIRPRCTAPSTAASAWWSWCRPSVPQTR